MKKKETMQLVFEFDEIPSVAEKKAEYPSKERFSQLNFKRSVMAWIVKNNPSGLGVMVPTRFSKYQADVAAFWSHPVKGRFLMPYKTLIVETRNNREDCWPDCSNKDEVLSSLKERKDEKRRLEAEIRNMEPNLKDTDNLFNEYESWNYLGSKNRKYHRCLKSIESLDHALYKGSRFEQIMRAHVANNLYLAVPAGIVHADEMADGWGLIYVHDDMKIQVVKEAEERECPECNRLHLVQNIASSCMKPMLHSFGIRQIPDGKTYFTKIPRVPRAKQVGLKLNIGNN